MSADPIVYCLEHLTDYRQFERLCTDVMNQSGYPDIEPLGGSNDRGRDAIHVSRHEPDDVTLFAYSVRADWEAKLLNEDCKRIREEGHELKKLVFACTSTITASQKDAVKQKVRNAFGWSLDLYDLERLRTRFVGDLRHLVAQHSSIFCPPFFPTRGGLSIAESRDTLVIDHLRQDHALASWLARRLQLLGFRTWCYGLAPLAGETSDDSIRLLIEQRAIRFLPVLSAAAVADVDFVARCGIAGAIDGLLVPCAAGPFERQQLPSKIQQLGVIDFAPGWSTGLTTLVESLSVNGIRPALSEHQGKAIAMRSYVPQPVTKESPEQIYSNTFSTKVPAAIQVCELARDLTDEEKGAAKRIWAFVQADSRTLLAFESPPDTIPLEPSARLAAYDWRHYDSRHGKRSTDLVKELVCRTLDVACRQAGLEWCEDRKKFYFPHGTKPQRPLSFTHVDGRNTWVAGTGEKSYGSGERATKFRYQLCPTFRVGYDEGGEWWTTMRIYVRVTDTAGRPYQLKEITRRRKKVTKSWWNQEWFARTLAVMQGLSAGNADIVVGTGSRSVVVSTTPLQWECPTAIDYLAVDRIGDFQEELAQLRYFDEADEDEADAERDETADE